MIDFGLGRRHIAERRVAGGENGMLFITEVGRAFEGAHGLLILPRDIMCLAEMDGAAIAMDDFTLPVTTRPLIVEGAGGVLVPLNDQATMCDLMVRLSLPVILVARTALGPINHSLLSIEALRARGIDLAGIVLCGPQDSANTAAIQAHGLVPVIGDLPRFESLTPQVLAAFADQHPPVLTKA